jgi:tRNA (Thr-GGU) A37 N-methylase
MTDCVVDQLFKYLVDLVPVAPFIGVVQTVDVIDDTPVLGIDDVDPRVERAVPLNVGHFFSP